MAFIFPKLDVPQTIASITALKFLHLILVHYRDEVVKVKGRLFFFIIIHLFSLIGTAC